MKAMKLRGDACRQVLGELDSYLSGQLSAPDQAAVSVHLQGCPECRTEAESRRQMRNSLKAAVHGVNAPPFLESRIRAHLAAPPQRRGWQWVAAPLGAVLMMAVGAGLVYQLGFLRWTTESQESYIRSVSNHVATIMRVGLGDHIHCAVFRKYPRQVPKLEDFAHVLGPEYKGLASAVRDKVPGDYQLMTAHRCRYHGRQFVHFTLTSNSRLVSLVISRKADGESFLTDQLAQQVVQDGVPFYRAGVQRFQIASFETPEHLVYMVSDLPQEENMRLMLAVAPAVQVVLSKLEG